MLNQKSDIYSDVIENLRPVLDLLDQSLSDDKITGSEQTEIMRAVAVLNFHMRSDLLGTIEAEDSASVIKGIVSNNGSLEA